MRNVRIYVLLLLFVGATGLWMLQSLGGDPSAADWRATRRPIRVTSSPLETSPVTISGGEPERDSSTTAALVPISLGPTAAPILPVPTPSPEPSTQTATPVTEALTPIPEIAATTLTPITEAPSLVVSSVPEQLTQTSSPIITEAPSLPLSPAPATAIAPEPATGNPNPPPDASACPPQTPRPTTFEERRYEIPWKAGRAPSSKCALPTPLMPLRDTAGGRPLCFDAQGLVQTRYSEGARGPGFSAAARTYCELSLLSTDLCNRTETFDECSVRLGVRNVEVTLTPKCTSSPFFKRLLNATKSRERSTPRVLPRLGIIQESLRENGRVPDPSSRVPFPPPHRYPGIPCDVHRILMAIPEENIVPSVPRDKLFHFSPYVPNPFPTGGRGYAMEPRDEPIAHEIYRRSYFAFTHRRGCWTAQRHYDILASGSVPFFPDLLLSTDPAQDMPLYPADLVKEALRLPGLDYILENATRLVYFREPVNYVRAHLVTNLRRLPVIDPLTFDAERYFALADRLLQWTKANLTTRVIATHFLDVMGVDAPRGVFVGLQWKLPCLTSLIHGLASLGVKVYGTAQNLGFLRKLNSSLSQAEVDLVRKNTPVHSAGFSYSMRAASRYLIECEEAACVELIANGTIDVAVYSLRGPDILAEFQSWPGYAAMVRTHGSKRVAILDSTDGSLSFMPGNWYSPHVCNHTLFSRETQTPTGMWEGRTEQ